MTDTIQRPAKRIALFLLALLLFLFPGMGLVTASQAGILPIKRAYIQMTVDTASWELLAGVVSTEAAALGGNQAESNRIGQTLLLALANTTKPSEVAGRVSASQKREGSNATTNLVMCFPGVMSVSGWNDDSTNTDTARAQLVRNSLIYDLNTAFKWVYGDAGGRYNPSGSSADDRLTNYASDMSSFLGAIPSGTFSGVSATVRIATDADMGETKYPDEVTTASDYVVITKDGESRIFQYRMKKGYVSGYSELGLPRIFSFEDAEYIHWGQMAVEAFVNYGSDEKLQVTAANVYESTPGALESAFAGLIGNIANGIANSLGLWNFDELIFNSGLRGTLNFVGGVFPNNWQPVIWGFFFISEVAAIAILLYAIIYNVGRKVMSTIDPVARASAIEQIKYLFIVAFILGLLPIGLPLLINVSSELTGIFHDMLGGKTATDRFKVLASNSGGLTSVLTYLIYLCALVYFNIFYMFRALTVALLIALGPIFVSLMALNENKRSLAVIWFKEFCANLFVQPLQAVMLSFILLVPASGRNIESIIMAYIMIPLTNMIRQLFFGSSGGLADQIAQKGKQEGKRVGSLAFGIGAGAVGGGIAAGTSAIMSKKKDGKDSQDGEKSGNDGSGGGSEQKDDSVAKSVMKGTARGAMDGAGRSMGSSGGSGDTGTSQPDTGVPPQNGGASDQNVSPGEASAASEMSDRARTSMSAGEQSNTAAQASDRGSSPADAAGGATTNTGGAPAGGDGNDVSDAAKGGGRPIAGAAMFAGAVALGMAGGGLDQFNKRVFGIMPGHHGGMITQLSRKVGTGAGNMTRYGTTSPPEPQNENSQNTDVEGTQENGMTNPAFRNIPGYHPDTPDGGYSEAMETEGRYDNPDGTSVYSRGFAERNQAPDGSYRYTIDPASNPDNPHMMRDAGIKNIHKAGTGQTAVSYDMNNLGKADQNRLMQMMNMWNNGSSQEHSIMAQAGIADIQPVTKMVNGQEQTVGATVTYKDDAVQKNFGINTKPASTGGKGIEVSTSGTAAPAIVPDVASYMNSTQASVSAVQGSMEQVASSTATFTQNGSGGVDITCQDANEFVAIEAMANAPISLTPQPTAQGYTATVSQETFNEAFSVESTTATQAVRAAAVEYTAPPAPPPQSTPAPHGNRPPRGSGRPRPAPNPAPNSGPVPAPSPGPTPRPYNPRPNNGRGRNGGT